MTGWMENNFLSDTLGVVADAVQYFWSSRVEYKNIWKSTRLSSESYIIKALSCYILVLATVPGWNQTEGPGPGQEPPSNPIRVTGAVLLPGPDIYPQFFGRVVPGLRFHITVPATLAPIENMSCDRIMTWPIRRLSRIDRSFTSRCHIGDPSNTRWVALKQRTFPGKIRRFLIATKWIFVRSQICTRVVKEPIILHNLRIDHVMIWSELWYSIGAKAVRLKCLVFGGKTGPIATVQVFVW